MILTRKNAFRIGVILLLLFAANQTAIKYFPQEELLKILFGVMRTVLVSIFVFSFYSMSAELEKNRLKVASVALFVTVLITYATIEILLSALSLSPNDKIILIPYSVSGAAFVYFGIVLFIEKKFYEKSSTTVSLFVILHGALMVSYVLATYSLLSQWLAYGGLVWLCRERKDKPALLSGRKL